MSAELLNRTLRSRLADLPDGALVVAFSGGLDSTVLLHALSALEAARARGLRALHVDHDLQADSADWAVHCTRIAAQFGISIDCVDAGPITAAGTGIEQAARSARYAAFARQLRPGEILAVAQHADDQAETVLLKLLRGAGPEGLGAMRELRRFENGHLWRPLLELPRLVLLEYADRHGLGWIDDPSNEDTRLRRNFLRHEILPRLREHWPEAETAIAHSARWARDAADFIGQQASLALARMQGLDPATLRWTAWLELPAALRDPVLRLWLRSLHLAEPAHFHVVELERQLATAGADSAPCLRWDGCEVRRYRDLLYAMPVARPFPPDWQAEWNGAALRLPDGSTLRWLRQGSGHSSAIDPPALAVRYRRGGERLRPAGSAHTRELRLLLQEAGVPPWQREHMPLIHADGDLLFVADLFASAAGRELCERVGARVVWERERRADG